MMDERTCDLIKKIYRKTFGYSLPKVIPNGDGTVTRLPSDMELEQQEIRERKERMFGKMLTPDER